MNESFHMSYSPEAEELEKIRESAQIYYGKYVIRCQKNGLI